MPETMMASSNVGHSVAMTRTPSKAEPMKDPSTPVRLHEATAVSVGVPYTGSIWTLTGRGAPATVALHEIGRVAAGVYDISKRGAVEFTGPLL